MARLEPLSLTRQERRAIRHTVRGIQNGILDPTLQTNIPPLERRDAFPIERNSSPQTIRLSDWTSYQPNSDPGTSALGKSYERLRKEFEEGSYDRRIAATTMDPLDPNATIPNTPDLPDFPSLDVFDAFDNLGMPETWTHPRTKLSITHPAEYLGEHIELTPDGPHEAFAQPGVTYDVARTTSEYWCESGDQEEDDARMQEDHMDHDDIAWMACVVSSCRLHLGKKIKEDFFPIRHNGWAITEPYTNEETYKWELLEHNEEAKYGIFLPNYDEYPPRCATLKVRFVDCTEPMCQYHAKPKLRSWHRGRGKAQGPEGPDQEIKATFGRFLATGNGANVQIQPMTPATAAYNYMRAHANHKGYGPVHKHDWDEHYDRAHDYARRGPDEMREVSQGTYNGWRQAEKELGMAIMKYMAILVERTPRHERSRIMFSEHFDAAHQYGRQGKFHQQAVENGNFDSWAVIAKNESRLL